VRCEKGDRGDKGDKGERRRGVWKMEDRLMEDKK
jgi:hypothetical protein